MLGIELGADNYVGEPFSPREVVARVIAILRYTSAHPPAVGNAHDLALGWLRLGLQGWRAARNDREVALSVTQFSILRQLA